METMKLFVALGTTQRKTMCRCVGWIESKIICQTRLDALMGSRASVTKCATRTKNSHETQSDIPDRRRSVRLDYDTFPDRNCVKRCQDVLRLSPRARRGYRRKLLVSMQKQCNVFDNHNDNNLNSVSRCVFLECGE